MDPFQPLLTACMCHCQDTDVALIALKCLMSFLRFDLPSIPLCARSLGTQTLKLLTSSGGTSNQNHDLIQACFKTLTYLISMDKNLVIEDDENSSSLEGGEQAMAKGVAMPLHSEQMQVLISLLKVSIAESEQHNPALGLIKAITSRRYVSPEFYDLMDTMLKMSVRSQKSSLRQVRLICYCVIIPYSPASLSPFDSRSTAKRRYIHSIFARLPDGRRQA
jgi:U3 small nucleolar RNA-associated protein 20